MDAMTQTPSSLPSINVQEVYLLERYSSLEYFGALRDKWEEMVKHVESCLTSFMQNVPANYRSRQLPERPDAVWGQRVLPNFRDTLQGLNTGFILLTHSDVSGLSYAHGPQSDFKGQFDYWSGWMSKDDESLYHELLDGAVTLARNICATEGAYWEPLDLSNYCDQWGPLNPPDRWPTYLVNVNVSISSGETLERSGIYVPSVENSCAEFLSTSYKVAPSARVLVGKRDLMDPATGEKYDEERILEDRNCVWYLVERDDDLGRAPQNRALEAAQPHRIPAGETCPETGFYITPAKAGSRRRFQKGEVMPDFETTYGATIWQWDSDQT
jgi:hypothetical protein